MRIVILTVGTRGDVAPYTGLGARLREAGHQVAVAAHDSFAPLIRDAGLGFEPMPLDLRAELAGWPGRQALGTSPVALARAARMLSANLRELGDAMGSAALGADLVLLSTVSWLGYHVAEGTGIPSMGVFLQPVDPTADFPPVVLTTRSLGRWGNRAAARVIRTAGQWPFMGAVGDVRARYGLPAIRPREVFRRLDEQRWPILYGFSPHVVAPPADWPPYREVVGYWWPYRSPSWQPPDRLLDFLGAGPPPVFVGFGSMSVAGGARLAELVASALRRARVRGVIQAGWADLSATGDDLLVVDDVPHEWLFARMGAVIHHAGAGTTAAGLRAGVPAVPVPVTTDQPFWASRLVRLGVSPESIPYPRLTAGRLANAVRAAVTDPAYRERASRLAERIAADDGAGRVVRAVNEVAEGRRRARPGC
jgi:sterol 3beta-glucosyltransferase